MAECGASDLYLTSGLPATWRADKIVEQGDEVLTNVNIQDMAEAILSKEDLASLPKNKELNLAYRDTNGERYRINIFYQMQNLGMVIRRVNTQIPTIDDYNLDDIYKTSIMKHSGLILVVGPAGSGKSTSIAAMLEHRNKHGDGHIITIEDPVEFVHQHDKCIFTQRDIGIDTNSWDEALKNTLRQRPDVIYIGEIRDHKTMQHALDYAETGHLCISTLHAPSASQAIERIANLAPEAENKQRLYTLSQTLRAIIAQRLVPSIDGESRVLATEILRNEGLMRSLIAAGNVEEIKELMYKNNDIGMMTFEQSLRHLYKTGKISKETAVTASENPDNMKLELMKEGFGSQKFNGSDF